MALIDDFIFHYRLLASHCDISSSRESKACVKKRKVLRTHMKPIISNHQAGPHIPWFSLLQAERERERERESFEIVYHDSLSIASREGEIGVSINRFGSIFTNFYKIEPNWLDLVIESNRIDWVQFDFSIFSVRPIYCHHFLHFLITIILSSFNILISNIHYPN